MFVGSRKKFEGGHECSIHRLIYILQPYFFHVFPKFKRGMPTVSSMTAPLRAYMLRIYSAVILVMAMNSLKMKQMVDFFCFEVVERMRAELISK